MSNETSPGSVGPQEEEVVQFRELASRYGKTAAFGVLVLLLAVIGATLFARRTRMKAREAEEMLIASRTTKDLETLIEQHPSSPVVPVALLSDAKLYYDSGNYTAALEKYGEFLARFPEHPMTAVASLGQILCAEARGDVQGALQRYDEFIAKHRGHYLVPEAVMAKGRCLEQLRRLEDARDVYQSFLARNERSGWTAMVRDLLTEVEREIDREARGKSARAYITGA